MEKILINGGFGSEETKQDEEITKICMDEIFEYCCVNFNFENYHFRRMDSLSEKYVYKHNGFNCDELDNHRVVPDGGVILLVNNENENIWFLIASAEDKYQQTNGNAIERYTKNFNFFYNDVTMHSPLLPYILFCKGSFIDDDGSVNNFLHSKIRISIPKTYPVIWNVNNPNTSFKERWNRIYMKKESFTKEEKYNVLLNTVLESIKHYSTFLK